MSSERQRLARQLYDRHQLFQVVDAQLQDMRSARHVVVGDEHRVTVGGTLDRRLDADGPARTRAVLDHDLLADRARHRFADDTRDEIQPASGRKRHDEAHRPIGPRGLGRALRARRVRTMRRLGDTAEQRDAPCCRAFDKRPPLDLGQFFLPVVFFESILHFDVGLRNDLAEFLRLRRNEHAVLRRSHDAWHDALGVQHL